MRQWYRRSIAVQGPTQEIPIAESRVEVDAKVKDFWGLPVARLSGGKHPKTMETSARDGGKGGRVVEGGGRDTHVEEAGGEGARAEASTRRARAAWATIRECRWWINTAACTITTICT